MDWPSDCDSALVPSPRPPPGQAHSRGGLGWGWSSPFPRPKTIPLLASPLKGEEHDGGAWSGTGDSMGNTQWT